MLTLRQQIIELAVLNGYFDLARYMETARYNAATFQARLNWLKPGTKNHTLISLVCRTEGATMDELVKATGWQKCSGTLGTLNRKLGLGLRREKVDGTFRFFGALPIAAPAHAGVEA